jgi:hypothetical protein
VFDYELNWNSIVSGTEETHDQALSLYLLLHIRQKVKPHVGMSYSIGDETDQSSVLQTFADRGAGLPEVKPGQVYDSWQVK